MSKHFEEGKKLADHYVDQLSDWAKITTRPLFGAVALCRGDHVFGMIWNGALYFKADDESQGEYEAAHSHPLEYASKGEERSLKTYWEVPADVLEDDDRLKQWADRAHQASLRAEKR